MKRQIGNVIKILINEYAPFSQAVTDLIDNMPDVSSDALLTYLHLISTPEYWHTSIDSIMSHTRLSRFRVNRSIKELENVRLLRREKSQINGRYEYNYVIYDVPFNATDSDEVDCNE